MLTPEQIKNLKPGDNLLLKAFFVEKDGDNIKFTLEPIYVPGLKVFSASPYSLRFLCGADRTFSHVVDNMVKPEHAPFRPFKIGDKVRTVKRRGRYNSSTDEKYADLILTVDSDEVSDTKQVDVWVLVETEDDEITWNTDPVYLELVTPVEEAPYKVWDTTFSFNVGIEDSKAVFYYGADMSTCPYTKKQAKAAAEAERYRLNAEWRKEQK